ncbi:MAG: TonB-dependent receptor [bacterium]|nr:MAG: TonB-dependent receptor [bacterium]
MFLKDIIHNPKRILFTGMLLIFQILMVNAQIPTKSDSLPQYRLSEIVVLGERLPESEVLPLYEIKQEEIQQLDATSARNLMEYVPGVYFSLTERNEYTFRLRGFEQRQVNVYLDGIPISVPFDGVVDIAQLGGDNFENVRISKGISSVLYGANTLGGNVNLITTYPSKSLHYRLRAEGSDQGRWFGNIQVSSGWKELRYSAGFSHEQSPNFTLPSDTPPLKNNRGTARDNSAFRKNSGAIKLHYHLHPSHRIGLHLNIIQNRFNVPPNALEERPRYWRFPEWQKNVVSLNSEHLFSDQFILRSVWYFDSYHNVLDAYQDSTYSELRFRSTYDDYSFGAILYPQFHYFTWGDTRGILSYKQDVHREKAADSDPYSKFSMHTITFGLEQYVQLSPDWRAMLGADGSYLNPLYADGGELREAIFLGNLQLTLNYSFLDLFKMIGSLSTNSRYPTLKELYSERLDQNIANPGLEHERALNMEIGFRFNDDEGYSNITLFNSRLTDLITNVHIEEGISQYQNIGKANLRGFELEVGRNLGNLNINTNYTYLQTLNQTSDRVTDYLAYRPKHRINGLLDFTFLERMRLHAEGSYTSDQYYQNPDNLQWEKLNDFGVVNVKFEFQLTPITLIYLRGNNLYDSFYFTEYGIPMPGREIILGVKLGK